MDQGPPKRQKTAARGQRLTLLLTGAPCAGKTTTLRRLADLLRRHGVRVVTTAEVATDLLSSGARLTETRFQQAVLQRQLADEAAAAACCSDSGLLESHSTPRPTKACSSASLRSRPPAS